MCASPEICQNTKMGSLDSILFIILLIIINQFMLHLLVEANDTLVPGVEINSLIDSSNLISAHGTFTFGFFTIPSTNLTYLGIWYTNKDMRVWIANRDNPLNYGTSGILMIDKSGTLKVVMGDSDDTSEFNVSNEIIGSGINTRAVLEDSGNFKLYDVANGNRTLWQSFDHPIDTLLPGMRLGHNLTTGQNWTLTSWLSDQIPASGAFTLSLEPFMNSHQLVMKRRGKVYWTSGQWMSEGFFQYESYFDVNDGIHLTLVSDASGWYLALQTHPSVLQLSSMGRITDGGNFDPSTQYYCYQSDQYHSGIHSHGCTFSMPLCRAVDDMFELQHGDFYGGYIIQSDDSLNICLIDCMERCWNDCSCKGFSSTNSLNGTGCTIFGGHLKHYTFTNDRTDQSQIGVLIPGYKIPKSKTWLWILVSVSGVLICVLTGPFCYARIRRRILQKKEKKRREDYVHQLKESDSFNYGDALEKGIKDAPDIKIFSLGAILAATNSFSIENKLGQGGYGPVYKGKLFDGREIAIKRLSKTSGQGIEEFKSELILISKLQHTNLVRLYGCCIHQEEKMLIYEYMPNKSLDFFLFAEDKKKKIDWPMRFNIVEGIAQGLLYLHKYSRMRVIHRDMKVSNVLLDENMNPKIADFGLARIFQQNVTEEITNRVVGTYGYMAPEYAIEGTFSVKSDVYSFGVLILEIVSGKRNSRFYNIDRPLNLVGYAWELWKEEAALMLKDETLESFDLKQVLRTIHVGLLCVQDNANDRPTMSEVLSMLNNEIADLPNPKQPVFIIDRQSTEDSSSKNIPDSVNSLSVTVMEAR